MKNPVVEYYNSYDEDGRLKRHKLEYLTTVEYFNRLFKPGSKILDACAGTGAYSIYLAEQGHGVTSGDLVPNNVDLIKQRVKASLLDDIQVMNVLDLSALADESFDVVLCMGALYHLSEETDQRRAIQECLRILKPGGILVLSYINRFAQFMVSVEDGLKNIEDGVRIFHNRTDSIFTYTTPEEIERLASQSGMRKIKNIGTDGMIYVLSEKVNGASKDGLDQLYGYHLATCEEPGILGASIHGLYFGQK